MEQITFSSICKVFRTHSEKDMSTISRNFLKLITDCDSVKDSGGKRYSFKPKELIEFFKGQASIYSNIKNAVKNISVVEHIKFCFIDTIDYLIGENDEDRQNDVYNDLVDLVNKDKTIDLKAKKDFLQYKTLDLLGKNLFIYAIQNENKTNPKKVKSKKELSIQETQNKIIELIKRLPKPIQIDIPNEIKESEITYVTAILEAFAEDAEVDVITKDDLVLKKEYKKYRVKLERFRSDFYKAESIRESLKDTGLEKQIGTFQKLEDDTYDAIIDKVEEEYPTSYKRLTSVLNHVTTVSLNSLISAVNWIGNSEKKGICHILVNERRIKWKL